MSECVDDPPVGVPTNSASNHQFSKSSLRDGKRKTIAREVVTVCFVNQKLFLFFSFFVTMNMAKITLPLIVYEKADVCCCCCSFSPASYAYAYVCVCVKNDYIFEQLKKHTSYPVRLWGYTVCIQNGGATL